MSQENVEIVRKSFAAIARGDVEAMLEFYDPDVRFLPLTGTRVESGGYHGHAGVRAYFAEVAGVWDEFAPTPITSKRSAATSSSLAAELSEARGAGSRATSPMAGWSPFEAARSPATGYRNSDEALEAAGLSE